MENLSKKPLNLVAHRGFASEFPENSLSAFQAAVDCGCKFLELDVQLTKDLVPIIIHDANLKRTGNMDINILASDFNDLENAVIGEQSRFGDKFEKEQLLRLEDFCQWLADYPEVKVFVEIKEESIEQFGSQWVLNAIEPLLDQIKSQVFLISFDASFLFLAKDDVTYPIGLVLHKFDETGLSTAQQLQPDILICNYKKIPDEKGSLWRGKWLWFLYEITEPALALKWHERGVQYIETMEIGPMISALTHEC